MKLITRGLENLLADERAGVLRFWREHISFERDGTKFAGDWDDIVQIVEQIGGRGPQGGYRTYLTMAAEVGGVLARLRKVMRLEEDARPAVGTVKTKSKRR